MINFSLGKGDDIVKRVHGYGGKVAVTGGGAHLAKHSASVLPFDGCRVLAHGTRERRGPRMKAPALLLPPCTPRTTRPCSNTNSPGYIVTLCPPCLIQVIATVVSEKHARSAVASGVDALMVTGHEAAAHGGEVTSLCLVPALASRMPDTPIIAAGGFANGRGLLAALSLGADAVAMGTRMAVTTESPLAEATKLAIVKGKETDTIYSKNFDGLWARVLKTE